MAKSKKPQQGRFQWFDRQSWASSALRTCRGILQSDVLWKPDVDHITREAACLYLLVNLHDLCTLAWDAGTLIETREPAVGPNVEDFHDLVRQCRNAACHIDSGNRIVNPRQSIGMSFRLFGGPRIVENDPVCEYEDDMAITFGRYRLYLRRHIYTAVGVIRRDFDKIFPNRPIQSEV